MSEKQKPENKKEISQKDQLQHSFVVGNLIKSTIYLTIAALFITGNFFLETGFGAGDSTDTQIQEISYTEENLIPKHGMLRFSENTAIEQDVILKHSDDTYLFDVYSGDFWANFTISDAKTNFVIGKVVIIPDRAAFSVHYENERLSLSVYDGDVYVGFLGDGIEVDHYIDQFDEIYINRLLVPRENQVTISMKNVSERIRPLLYSKLVKEFKYSGISSSSKESEWIKGNQKADTKYIEEYKQDYASSLVDRGTRVGDNFVSSFVFWSEENLTFVPEKKREMLLGHLFACLEDSIFYASEGDRTESEVYWDDFEAYAETLPFEILDGEQYAEQLDSYLFELVPFGPDHNLHKSFEDLIQRKKDDGADALELVGLLWHNVYRGLNDGSVSAQAALNEYYDLLDDTLGERVDPDYYRSYIIYQNQLLDNLLLRYPAFYKDSYFGIKDVLEKELLELYETGRMKDELAQAFISSKIKFLQRLRKFFFDDDVSIEEAKKILERLFAEIDDLKPTDSNAAVMEIFQSNIDEIANFYGYLKTPEYHVSRTYGANHEERYESYMSGRDEIESYESLQEDILGESSEDYNVADVLISITKVFEADEDISEFELGDIEDSEQRYIEVKGIISGYPFDAMYDRSQDNLIEVYVYEELISEFPIVLDDLPGLIDEEFSGVIVDEDNDVEATAAMVAAHFVASKISEYGFVAEMDDVSVVDTLNAVYRVEEIHLEDEEEVKVTFDLLMNGEIVTNLILTGEGEPLIIDGKHSLEELKNLVLARGEDEEAVVDEEKTTSGSGPVRR